MTKYDKAVSVCFSGHRSVPFAKRRELKQCLKSEIAKAYADGYRYFYCGMAMGFDLLAAEAALSLQCELKDLQVIAVVPFRGQSDRWSKEEQAKYDAILRIVDDVVVLPSIVNFRLLIAYCAIAPSFLCVILMVTPAWWNCCVRCLTKREK